MSRIAGTAWRRKAYAALVARDGERCGSCGITARTIWRRMGSWSGERWGPDPRERWQYTKVNRSSSLEIEHVLALRDGGTNLLENLQLLCIDCHKVKSAAERTARSSKR